MEDYRARTASTQEKNSGPVETSVVESTRVSFANDFYGLPPRQAPDDWILRRSGLLEPSRDAVAAPETACGDGGCPAKRGTPAAIAAATLSTSHIRPDTHEPQAEQGYFVGVNGQVVVLNKGGEFAGTREDESRPIDEMVKKGPEYGGGDRGVIKGFSAGSRRRFLRTMGQWNPLIFELRLVLGVTLTYPMEFPTARTSQRDLKAFVQRLERRYPGTFGVWKKEPQKRGAPHYHLVLAFSEEKRRLDDEGLIDFREGFQAWLAEVWYEIVGSGDTKHYLFHLSGERVVERIHSYRQFMGYLAKYIGKAFDLVDGWHEPGRFWGVIERDSMKEWMWGRVWKVDRAVYVKLRRVMRKHAPPRVQQYARDGDATWWTWGSESMVIRLVGWASASVQGIEWNRENWAEIVEASPPCEQTRGVW